MVKAETSLIEAVRMGTPNFGMLNAGRGNLDASKSTISVLLLNLLDYFTAEWNMTQLEDCSEIIATDFYWLTQAEFKIFTLRCKKGHFGTDYGKLSPQRLLLWLEDFSQECRFERADYSRHQAGLAAFEQPDVSEQVFLLSEVMMQLAEALGAEEDLHRSEKIDHYDKGIVRSQQRLRFRWENLQSREIK